MYEQAIDEFDLSRSTVEHQYRRVLGGYLKLHSTPPALSKYNALRIRRYRAPDAESGTWADEKSKKQKLRLESWSLNPKP